MTLSLTVTDLLNGTDSSPWKCPNKNWTTSWLDCCLGQRSPPEHSMKILFFKAFSPNQVWHKHPAANIGCPEHGTKEDRQRVSLCWRTREYSAHFICLFGFSERIWHHQIMDTGSILRWVSPPALAFSWRKSQQCENLDIKHNSDLRDSHEYIKKQV